MVKIKDASVLRGVMVLGFAPKLIDIACWVYDTFDDLVITSGFRDGDTGVHGAVPCRGLDIRSWIYKDAQVVVDAINARWVYDPTRPEKMCAILHDIGQGNHIHLQSHPGTKLKP